MPDAKYRDQDLAERLYPVYEKNGTIEAVYDHCCKNGIPITKPTLGKMADYFFWKEKRDKAIKKKFSLNPDSGDPLFDLLIEVASAKDNVKKILETSGSDLNAHRIFGQYVGQMLDILKEINKRNKQQDAVKAVDKAQKSGGLTPGAAEEIRNKILGSS